MPGFNYLNNDMSITMIYLSNISNEKATNDVELKKVVETIKESKKIIRDPNSITSTTTNDAIEMAFKLGESIEQIDDKNFNQNEARKILELFAEQE